MKYKIKPWDHQLRAIEMASRERDFALFMQMGTGKTGASINILRHHFYKNSRILRTLILCPIIVCTNWRREFGMHSSVQKKTLVLTGPGKKRLELFDEILEKQENVIIITNYEALSIKSLYDRFLSYKFEIVIADESQKIKNPKAKRTKLVWSLGDQSRHNYALSGTPLTNGPMDIFGQYRFLDRGKTFGKNFFAFRAKYFVDKNAGMPANKHFPDWRPRPNTENIFNDLIYKKAIRVKKEECLDLPPLVRKRIDVALSKEQERAYSQMYAAFVAYLGSDACVAEMAITKTLRLQQILSGFAVLDGLEDATLPGAKKVKQKIYSFEDIPRIKALTEIIENLDSKSKFIIWCCYRENYRMVENVVNKMGIGCVKLVGGMNEKARDKAMEDFEKDPGVRCVIANQAAASVGVNLIAASYSIYYSRTYNLEHDEQSEARNHRGGSEIHDRITRIDLVAPGTVDEDILEALAKKQTIAEAILAWKKRLID